MASAASAFLRAQPGYGTRPKSTAVVSPNFPALPKLPQVPAIDDARAPNAATRAWLLQQLGPLSQQHQARLTNVQAGAKLGLAGYGGWKFGTDDPGTPQREDLNLSFDPSTGLGERERMAVSGERNAANARGLAESSFAAQNIASALQRLSLEGQQVANQYAGSLMQEFGGYAGQVASLSGEWTSLYGQDAAWLVENPPPPPPLPPAQQSPVEQAKQAGTLRWVGKNPPNLQSLAASWGVPASAIKVYKAGPKSKNRYLARLY